MSIIHDALKKIQQGQAPKSDEKPSGYIYSTPPGPQGQADPSPVEQILPKQNEARSMLALFCIIAFFLGSLIFSYKQTLTYLYQTGKLAKSSFYKLIHKEELPDFKTKAAKDLVPLAKITVNPPKPPVPVNTPGFFDALKPHLPQTLNVHGVMSNGQNNVVLINDQVYQEGDEIDGVKIIKINLDSLTVINNGKEEKIRVKN